MAMQLVTRTEARMIVSRSLGLDASTTTDEIHCELLRAMAWALTGGTRSVHILRLLNRATEIAAQLTPDVDEQHVRDELREALDALSESGDLVELDGGEWQPAPARFVKLGVGESVLLVGGVPTRCLPAVMSSALLHHGPFRRIQREFSELELPLENVESWSRIPPGDSIEDWTKRLMASDLPAYEEPREGTALEIYAPIRAPKGAPQFKRWAENAKGLTGRHLAKRSRVFWKEYRVVEIQNDRVVRSGSVLGRGEARRLMYGLDVRAQNPVVAEWSVRSTEAALTLRSELPRPEQRLFAALGTLEIPEHRRYMRQWTFRSHHELVRERLAALRIVIRETPWPEAVNVDPA